MHLMEKFLLMNIFGSSKKRYTHVGCANFCNFVATCVFFFFFAKYNLVPPESQRNKILLGQSLNIVPSSKVVQIRRRTRGAYSFEKHFFLSLSVSHVLKIDK
jgi:hypothetical protein